jgi:hypothetical protein
VPRAGAAPAAGSDIDRWLLTRGYAPRGAPGGGAAGPPLHANFRALGLA